MLIPTLQINPVVKTQHYQFFFNCSSSTASRMKKLDTISLNKNYILFSDFFTLYNSFPCPKFCPKWKNLDIDFNIENKDLKQAKNNNLFLFFKLINSINNKNHIAHTNKKTKNLKTKKTKK